jgi:hypothetical protein
VLVTPNRLPFGRPDEIIDPYHFVEFDADELRALCSTHFRDVRVLGIFGSERYMRIHDEERRRLAAILRLDPLRLRRLIPRTLRQSLYDWRLGRERTKDFPGAAEMTPQDFTLAETDLDLAVDLLAVCSEPNADC